MPDRDQARAWSQRLRQSGGISTLPAHIPYRLAAVADAAEARYVDVDFPDDPGPVDARIIVRTEHLIIEVQSQQIDVRVRTASGHATTTVTLRPLSDVRHLAIAGDDVDWSPEQYGDVDPTLGFIVATLVDGTDLALPGRALPGTTLPPRLSCSARDFSPVRRDRYANSRVVRLSCSRA